ncbi:pre-mRNA processing factor 3-domain-containing protein [Hyaloraphidium curvatum]|nr:pre-mRNA processing factor 3-domain-containing protein [Hyaloraphidium curvatum]
MAEKRRGSSGIDDERDAKRLRSADGSPAASPAAGNRSQGTLSAQIDAMIAQKKAEIAAKLAAMKPGAAPSPGAAAPLASAARPPPPVAGAGPTPRPPVAVNQTDLARRIAEAKERIKSQMSAANVPTLPPPGAEQDRTKRGLAVETHPVLELLAQKGEEAAKGAKAAKAIVPKPVFATTKANLRLAEIAEQRRKKKEQPVKPAEEEQDPTKSSFYDPRIASTGAFGPRDRRSRKLKFNAPGKYIQVANQVRAQAQLEKLRKEIAEKVKQTGMESEMELVSDQAIRREAPPDVEWWDAPLLRNPTYEDLSFENFRMDPDAADAIITSYVQHPVPVPPPVSDAAPAPKPLMMTKKERKKLRRQLRMERQKEKQDKIRMGLLPPDPPKVRIANLMRVLGTEAVQDPTKVEAEVRRQMMARQRAHQKHNEEKKLTKEERQEKLMKKLVGSSETVVVGVFRITDLSHPQKKFKVERNAMQLQMTGIGIVNPTMSVVIVEGTPKSLKFYKKLMLRRIDWNDERAAREAGDDEDEDSDEDDSDDDGAAKPESSAAVPDDPASGPKRKNECHLVWEGEIKEQSFRRFKLAPCPTEFAAKEMLEKFGAVQYWDIAKQFVPAETVI